MSPWRVWDYGIVELSNFTMRHFHNVPMAQSSPLFVPHFAERCRHISPNKTAAFHRMIPLFFTERGAKTLNRFATQIDESRTGSLAFKMILTAVGSFAYTRKEDGIVVCPISALKP